MSVFVVRAFVRLNEMLVNNRQLAVKLDELERRLETHDGAIQEIIEAIKALMIPKQTPRKKIGFQMPAGKPVSLLQRSAFICYTDSLVSQSG